MNNPASTPTSTPTSTPAPAEQTAREPYFKLIVFMYGLPEYQEPFWQRAFVDTGLAPYCVHGAQINAFSARLYADDMIKRMTLPEIADAQYHHALRSLERFNWLPQGAKHTFAMIDYEPSNRDADPGDPAATYLRLKQLHGYTQNDIDVHAALLKGTRRAAGLPCSFYRMPTMPKAALSEAESERYATAAPIMAMCDWGWQHEYALDEDLTAENSFAMYGRINSHAAVFGDADVTPYMAIWGGYTLEPRQAVNRLGPVAYAAKARRDTHLVCWNDMNTAYDLREHTENMVALAPVILDAMGVG